MPAIPFEDFSNLPGVRSPKPLPNKRAAWLYDLMYTVAICVGPLDDGCYDDRWCYHDAAAAQNALDAWDGTGEPTGWHRHPFSGRRRPDGDSAREYTNP